MEKQLNELAVSELLKQTSLNFDNLSQKYIQLVKNEVKTATNIDPLNMQNLLHSGLLNLQSLDGLHYLNPQPIQVLNLG